jgi:hypothetical protein
MKRREITFLIFSILVAAIFGGLIGDIVSGYLPDGSTAKLLFGTTKPVGFEATKFDVFALSFTVVFIFRVNFMSLLFVIFVLIYFRWWYI